MEVEPTLESLVVEQPEPTSRKKQHFCADKGYDYPDGRKLVNEWGYTAHIKSRGEEEAEPHVIPGYRSRRWVLERTHSWFNRFRRLLIHWEKNSANYLALLHFACAWVSFPAAAVLGWALLLHNSGPAGRVAEIFEGLLQAGFDPVIGTDGEREFPLGSVQTTGAVYQRRAEGGELFEDPQG